LRGRADLKVGPYDWTATDASSWRLALTCVERDAGSEGDEQKRREQDRN
jgi:hypothetical protein